MSTASKSALLKGNAVRAIDAIVNDTELDDDTKDEIFDELATHIEDSQRILGGDDEDEDDDDEGDEDEAEDEDE